MISYRILFEYRKLPSAEWQQHSGTFKADNPIALRNAVLGQLKHMGYETRGYVVYDGEFLALGAPLPIKLRTQRQGHA